MNSGVELFLNSEGALFAMGTIQAARGRNGAVLAVADSHGSEADCADTDGDGASGLVRLRVVYLDIESGATWLGVAEPADGADLHRKGRHRVRVLLHAPNGSALRLRGVLRLRRDLFRGGRR